MNSAKGQSIMEELYFAGYKFLHSKACLICEHVFSMGHPKVIVHDHDGWLQFFCGLPSHEPSDSKTVALSEMMSRLPCESEINILKPGQYG